MSLKITWPLTLHWYVWMLLKTSYFWLWDKFPTILRFPCNSSPPQREKLESEFWMQVARRGRWRLNSASWGFAECDGDGSCVLTFCPWAARVETAKIEPRGAFTGSVCVRFLLVCASNLLVNEMDFCWPQDLDAARRLHQKVSAGQDLFPSRAAPQRLEEADVWTVKYQEGDFSNTVALFTASTPEFGGS